MASKFFEGIDPDNQDVKDVAAHLDKTPHEIATIQQTHPEVFAQMLENMAEAHRSAPNQQSTEPEKEVQSTKDSEELAQPKDLSRKERVAQALEKMRAAKK